MTSERIKEIQKQTSYPESISVMLALKRVWIECEQEYSKNIYSEEEMNYLLYSFKNYLEFGEEIDEKEWLKQFKK